MAAERKAETRMQGRPRYGRYTESQHYLLDAPKRGGVTVWAAGVHEMSVQDEILYMKNMSGDGRAHEELKEA